MHFTEDGEYTHCHLRLRENSVAVTPSYPENQPHCRRCLRWHRIYHHFLAEFGGDIEAAREQMKHTSY
ncbi:hypothetical protein ACINK0_11155 [Deinococcus sp. VB343]|uniref:hypothetical protein n=1 Tax=Deinococcus sp. VB343 TaxID=3385567 RepID=UPI0039C9BBDA